MSEQRRASLAILTATALLSSFFFAPAAHAQGPAAAQMLADFEDGTTGFFSATKGAVVDTKHLDGKALLLKQGQNVAVWQPKVDWSAFNVIRVDAWNPADAPVRLQFCFKDDSAPHGYFSWINRYISAKSGRSTIELFIPALRRGEGSPKDMLDTRPFHWDKMQWFGISTQGEIELDNFRVERVDVSIPEGIFAFDFGPPDQPVFPGTVGVSPDDVYADARGFGWSTKREIYTRKRHSAPDDFVRDWISGNNATFSVKLPNGKYHVWLMWADPGEWELVQHAPWRNIQAEGRTVLEEKMTGEEFLDFYFHFAETEDFPGEDIYQKYVMWRYRPATFEVDVTDGRLDLTIHGPDQYACTVNGLVVYPEPKKKEGEAYIASLMKRRREAFYKSWNEKLPKRETRLTGMKLGSCIVNLCEVSKDIGIYDTAAEGQLSTEFKVKLAAARGEHEPFSFWVHALNDLPELKTSVSELKSDDGNVLPAGAFDVRVVRYKFKRIGFAGAGVYGVMPWILVDGTTTSAKQGITRRWWVMVHVPKDQPAGFYRGTVSVSGSAKFELPVEVRVLPIELPEADMGLGMFGMGGTAPYFPYFEENRARNEADKRRSLQCARDHGFTYYAVHRGMRFTGFEDGKARYDVSNGKARVEEARRLGFTVLDMYGDTGIARQALDDKGPLARKNGFASPDDLVKEVFGAAARQAKAAGLPEPIYCFGDEPPDTQAPVFVALHKRMRELAGAKSEISWSPHGEPTHELLDVTSICSLNVTDLEQMKRAQAAGNVVYLNNQGRSRWAYGLYMWKAREAGVKAYQQFCWMGTHADPYYPLDSYEDDGGHVYPDRKGNLRPKVDLERVREGIDDYRYTLALTRAIGDARAGAKKGIADEAQNYLDSVLGRLKFEDTRRDRQPQMTEAELDAYRAKVQDYLLKLSE